MYLLNGITTKNKNDQPVCIFSNPYEQRTTRYSNTNIHDFWFSWVDTDTLIRSLSEMRRSFKRFLLANKMSTLIFNYKYYIVARLSEYKKEKSKSF